MILIIKVIYMQVSIINKIMPNISLDEEDLILALKRFLAFNDKANDLENAKQYFSDSKLLPPSFNQNKIDEIYKELFIKDAHKDKAIEVIKAEISNANLESCKERSEYDAKRQEWQIDEEIAKINIHDNSDEKDPFTAKIDKNGNLCISYQGDKESGILSQELKVNIKLGECKKGEITADNIHEFGLEVMAAIEKSFEKLKEYLQVDENGIDIKEGKKQEFNNFFGNGIIYFSELEGDIESSLQPSFPSSAIYFPKENTKETELSI